MKIGIITIHYGINYGSVLQTYALFSYIVNNFKDVEVNVINYIPHRYNLINRYTTCNKKNCGILKLFYLIYQAPLVFINQRLFNEFINQYVILTKKVNTEEEAKNITLNYDLLITGSDQVWNSDFNRGVDRLYYLTFANDNCKKISYAASCGKILYSKDELIQMRNLLEVFDGISVREFSARNIIMEQCKIKDVKLVLDPIFLLSKDNWKKIAIASNFKDKYLFIYCLDGDEPNVIKIAHEIARKKGLKIVMVSFGYYAKTYDYVDLCITHQSPNKFLGWMLNADFIVTNSFHGVAFSLNLEKQFIAVERQHYNTRLFSIMELVGLTERLVKVSTRLDNLGVIDYKKINLILCELKRISCEYIKKFIVK